MSPETCLTSSDKRKKSPFPVGCLSRVQGKLVSGESTNQLHVKTALVSMMICGKKFLSYLE